MRLLWWWVLVTGLRRAPGGGGFLPEANRMLDAIHERIVPLPGHQVITNPTTGELLRRNRNGV